MAVTEKEVIISIKTDYKDALNQLARLSDEYAKLKLELDAVRKTKAKDDEESRQQVKALEDLSAQIRSVNDERKMYRQILDEEIAKNKLAEGSIASMRNELKELRSSWEHMSEAERNSADGDETVTRMQELAGKIKELEKTTRDFNKATVDYRHAIDGMGDYKDTIEQLGRLRQHLEELKEVRKGVQEGVKSGKISEQEGAQAMESLDAQIRQTTADLRTYRKELDEEVKTANAADGSINQMREQIKLLRREYENLSKAERDSAAGQEMKDHIRELTEEVKKLEAEQGDFRRNVGNYMSAFDGMLGPLGKVRKAIFELSGGTMKLSDAFKGGVGAVKSFGKELWGLMKNPYVALIAAIVKVLMDLRDAFKKNDDAMTALQGLMSSLQPIMEVFGAILEVIVKGLTKVIQGVTGLITGLLSLSPVFAEEAESTQAYIKRMDDLEEAERQYTVNHAKRERDIAVLRDKAAQSDTYSAKQRKKFLLEAIEIQKKDLEERKANALEKWKLLEMEAAKNHDTSDETKNAIAQAHAAYINAEADVIKGMRRMRKEISTLNKQIAQESLNTALKIINNERKTSAERIKAYKEREEAYRRQVENFQKMLDSLSEEEKVPGNKVFDWITESLNRATESLEKVEDDGYNMMKSLADKAKDRRDKELDAQRAFEDAVLENMDDNLEKQVQAARYAGEREIEDLKEKIRTEENLSEEAKDYLNRMILEKEKTLNRNLAVIQAEYWSERRDELKNALRMYREYGAKFEDALNPTGKMFSELENAFQANISGFEDEMETMLDRFPALMDAMVRKVNDYLDKIDTSGFSDRLKALMKSVTSGTLYKTRYDIEVWMGIWNQVKEQLTDADAVQFREITKPWLDEMDKFYRRMLEMPKEYGEKLFNDTIKSMQEWSHKVNAEAVRLLENPITNASVEWMEGLMRTVFNDIEVNADRYSVRVGKAVENALAGANGSVKAFFDGLKAELGPLANDVLNALEKSLGNWQNVVGDRFQYVARTARRWVKSLKEDVWDLNWEGLDNSRELQEEFGDELENSIQGVLRMVSGLTDENQQLKWLAENYDLAIEKIRKYNRERQNAFIANGDANMRNAEIDEGIVGPIFRYLADNANMLSTSDSDYLKERLDLQKKYWEAEDKGYRATLQYEAKLSELDAKRYRRMAENWEARAKALEKLRPTVAKLEQDMIAAQLQAQTEIRDYQTELTSLESRLKGLKEKIDNPETGKEERDLALQQYDELVQRQSELNAKIDESGHKYQEAADKLKETGFSSTAELDTAADNALEKAFEYNEKASRSGQDAAQKWTQAWLMAFTSVTGGVGRLSQSFQSLFEEMGEDAEHWQRFAEAASYVTIGVSMAEGIAEAVAAGASVPFPGNIAAIASGIAAVVGAIAEAMSVYKQYHSKTPKYATGGLITSGTTKRADDVPIWASRGEYVINADAVQKYGKDFFDAINFGSKFRTLNPGGKYADGGQITNVSNVYKSVFEANTLVEAFESAAGMIQPVVSVKEITAVQTRVRAKESIARR